LFARLAGPDFQDPGVGLAPSFDRAELQTANVAELDQWWQLFGDETLNQLVMRSQSQNLDLLTAYERIVEARANLRLVGGQLLPNADSFSGYQFTKRSQNASPFVAQNGNSFNLFTRGLDASWEIDLFGRIKRTIESAEAELGFQEFEQESVRQSLNADIASSYLSIRLLQAQVSETEESLAVQSDGKIGCRAIQSWSFDRA
jgi:outer membrane protein TolC